MNNIEKYDAIGAMCADDWSGQEDSFIDGVIEILKDNTKPEQDAPSDSEEIKKEIDKDYEKELQEIEKEDNKIERKLSKVL